MLRSEHASHNSCSGDNWRPLRIVQEVCTFPGRQRVSVNCRMYIPFQTVGFKLPSIWYLPLCVRFSESRENLLSNWMTCYDYAYSWTWLYLTSVVCDKKTKPLANFRWEYGPLWTRDGWARSVGRKYRIIKTKAYWWRDRVCTWPSYSCYPAI